MPTTASRFFKEIPVEYLEDKTTLQPKVAKVMQDLGVRNAAAPKKEVYMTKGFGSSVNQAVQPTILNSKPVMPLNTEHSAAEKF